MSWIMDKLCTRDATILHYIDIHIAISIAAIQYNISDKNIDILLIAIRTRLIKKLKIQKVSRD